MRQNNAEVTAFVIQDDRFASLPVDSMRKHYLLVTSGKTRIELKLFGSCSSNSKNEKAGKSAIRRTAVRRISNLHYTSILPGVQYGNRARATNSINKRIIDNTINPLFDCVECHYGITSITPHHRASGPFINHQVRLT